MPFSGLHGHTLDAQIGIKINAKKKWEKVKTLRTSLAWCYSFGLCQGSIGFPFQLLLLYHHWANQQ